MFRRKAKEQTPPEAGQTPQDEALFEALGKNRKAKRQRLIRRVLILVAVAAVALFIGVRVLQNRVRQELAPTGDEVLSAQAQRGSISTVVSGSGQLTNVDTETVTVPSGVEVTEILAEAADQVEKGTLLAVADMATVRSAMSQLQEELDSLDKQIAAAEDDTVSSTIRAGVPGRVKLIYGEPETPVKDTMVEHGGLAVISLDGYMAVDIQTDALEEADTVTVLLSDGEATEGSVERVVGDTATVLVSDDGPAWGQEVTVQADGADIGTGTLYIHNPLTITGYAGTVRTVHVKENQKVYAGTTLFTLTDTSTSASFDTLLRSRGEKEEDLLELLQIQRNGGLTAPISGSVYSIAELEDGVEIVELATISPDKSMSVTISVDESDILSLETEQQAEISVSSINEEGLSGTVTEVNKTDTDGAYTAVITLDKISGMLPGMTADVEIRIEGVEDAILIPVDALHQTSAGYYVYTSYDEQTQEYGGRVDVVPGIQNSDYVQIKSGLNEGDTVFYTEKETFPSFFGAMGGAMGGGSRGGNFGGSGSGSGDPGGNMPGGGMPGAMSGRG